jgi:hypothetical protein
VTLIGEPYREKGSPALGIRLPGPRFRPLAPRDTHRLNGSSQRNTSRARLDDTTTVPNAVAQ